MTKLKIILIFILGSISLYSKDYTVYENESGLKISFEKVFDGDSLLLPEYMLYKDVNKQYLKLNLVSKDNEIDFVKLNERNIEYQYKKDITYRGVDINHLLVNTNLLLDNSILEIKFKNKTNLSNKTSPELSLFPTTINKRHLRYILNTKTYKDKDKNNNLLNSEDYWYDYNKTYLKLITDKDGIWKVDINKVIAKFGNVEINNFFITKYGQDYDNFYIKSNDNLLSVDDEFYLVGQTAKGDSTNYEHYTNEVVYYLYHNPEIENQTLSIDNKQINNFQEYIERDYFYERDSLYSFGFNFTVTSTENNYYEGWYMALLDPTSPSPNSNVFEIETRAFPYKNESNTQARVVTFLELIPGTFGWFNIHPYQNNLKLDTIALRGFNKLNIEFDSNALLPGINNYTVESNIFIKSLEKFRSGEEIIEPGRIGVDYLTFNGKFYPIADNGHIEFGSDNNIDSYVNIYNYNSKNIVSIDTTQKSIQFKNASKSDFIVGGINFESDFSTLSYNDISLSLKEKGAIIIYGEQGQDKYLVSTSVSEIISIINKDLDYFTLLSNFEDIGNLSSVLNSEGINVNSANFIAGRFGNELVYNNLTLFDNEFFSAIEWEGAKKYTSKINILTGKSDIISCDSENIEFVRIEDINFGGLRNIENKADVLFVSHKSLESGLQKYLDYRRSTHPELDFKLVFVEDIYDEFGYGQEKPHAVKDFLKYAHENWTEPKVTYVYFIGEASWDPEMKGESSRVKNLVPTYGLPVSDVWYQNLTRDDIEIWNDVLVSRITPNNNNELEVYLEKLIEFEKTKKASWLKDFLVILGGNESEQVIFNNQTELAYMPLTNSSLCVDTNYIHGLHDKIERSNQGNEIRREINNGVLWTNFIGHGAVNIFDFDGWAENQLNNFGRTGILSTISCNTNAFAEAATPRSRNEAYIMYPETGFIFTFGGTTLGTISVQYLMISNMFRALSDKNFNLRNVLELKNFANMLLSEESFYVSNYLTFNNLGDPLINIPLALTTDLYPLEDETQIIGKNSFITIDDSLVTLSSNIYNNGYKDDENVVIKTIHNYGNNQKIYFDTLSPICVFANFKREIEIDDYFGVHNIIIITDPDNVIEEDDKENNRLEITFNVFNSNLIPIEPKNNWNISKSNQRFRFFDPKSSSNRAYKFRLEYDIINYNEVNDIENIEKISIESKNEEIIILDGSFVTWEPSIELPENTKNIKLFYFTVGESEETLEQLLNLHIQEVLKNETSYLVDKSKISKTNLDIIDNNIQFKTQNNEFYLSSQNAKYMLLTEPDREHFHEFEFTVNGETVLISTAATTGIYLAKISSDASNEEPVTRVYDTWGFVDGKNYFDDGIAFVNFLKDSVSDDEFVFFSVVGPGLRVFDKHCESSSFDYCLLDTLIYTLEQKYSAELAYTLREDYLNYEGYSFYGSPSFDKSQKIEFVAEYDEENNSYVKPIIQGNFDTFFINGNISLESLTDAQVLNSLRIEGESDEDGSNEDTIKNELNLELYDSNDNLIETISDFKLNSDYDLNEYNQTKLKFTLNIIKNKLTTNFVINDIYLNYKSYPELGLINNSQNTDSLLRGEEYILNYNIKNYSFRNDYTDINFILRNNNLQVYQKNFDFISSEFEITLIDTLSTNNMQSNNILTGILNSQFRNSEPISNNNISVSGLSIYEDTIPPVLKVYANGVEVSDQSFISTDPVIRVEMYDNSKLPINDKKNFSRIRFNGWIEDDSVTFNNDFNYQDNGELKAYIEFPKSNLDVGEFNTNLIEITAQDASGNQTSVEYYLNIARVVNLDGVIAYPNPFSDQVSLKFNYKGYDEPQLVEILIYDLNGRFINKIERSDVRIGSNVFIWDGKDQNGNKIITGNYLVLMRLKDFNNSKKNILIQKE